MRENVDLLINGEEDQLTDDVSRLNCLTPFFVPPFIHNFKWRDMDNTLNTHEEGGAWSYSRRKSKQIREYLAKLDTFQVICVWIASQYP